MLDGIKAFNELGNIMRPNTLTNAQIIEAFPEECRTLIPKEIRHLNSLQREYEKHKRSIRNYHLSYADENLAFQFLDAQFPTDKLRYLEKLKQLYAEVQNPNQSPKKQCVSDDQINSARAHLMTTVYPFERLRRAGSRHYALCPFHNEKTGSFVIYQDNSWHCFGCHANGQNAIDFIMRLESLPFVQAVERLAI